MTRTGPNLRALHAGLVTLPEFASVKLEELVPMSVKGLAHDHVSVAGYGALLRIPKQSQFGLSALDNLTYQTACFERVARAHRSPRPLGVILPNEDIPLGAIVADQIEGRPPRLPLDLPKLADAMARIHALPLPPPQQRPPLEDHKDPVAGILREIEQQARFLEETNVGPASRREIDAELSWAMEFPTLEGCLLPPQPQTLVLTDTHPGNFLIDARDHAIIVDLEKALYGSPGIDLAHATVYSSTTWDPDTWADLNIKEVSDFYRHYLGILAMTGNVRLAETLRSWLLPMRRLLFLRAITWCVKWKALHGLNRKPDKQTLDNTEDWSAENSDPALIEHVAGRVEDYLSPATLERMREEWMSPDSPLHDI